MSAASSVTGWAVVCGLAALPIASSVLAADLSIEGPFATADAVYCMGTLHITSDTVADTHYGDIKIQGPGSFGACDVVCGDGVVEGLEECDPMGSAPGCSANCKWLRFPEYGGSSPHLDPWADILECRNRPAPVPDSSSGRDVTFLAFGDSQYGNNTAERLFGPGITKDRVDANRRNILAMNRVEELRWPNGFVGAGERVADVRGVILAGDVTQESDACTSDYYAPGANCGWISDPLYADRWYAIQPPYHDFEEYAQFNDPNEGYGLCGEKLLDYPMFEGAGNHDYWRDVGWGADRHPVIQYIGYRSNYRKGVDAVDPAAKGLYSWTWDDVHFVQLGLAAKDRRIERTVDLDPDPDDEVHVWTTSRMDTFQALSFLRRDLALNATPSQPIVLVMHYPWVGNDGRYSVEDRLRLFQVIKNYNVVALIHGHNHASFIKQWSPCDDVGVYGSACAAELGVAVAPSLIPVIDAGNPFYGNGNNRVRKTPADGRRYGHYTVVRITDDWLEAATVSWNGLASLCTHTDSLSCWSDPECKWIGDRCLQNGELCLPGVKTIACWNGQAVGPDDCPLTEQERYQNARSGWTFRGHLTNVGTSTTHAPLYEYCPTPVPEPRFGLLVGAGSLLLSVLTRWREAVANGPRSVS